MSHVRARSATARRSDAVRLGSADAVDATADHVQRRTLGPERRRTAGAHGQGDRDRIHPLRAAHAAKTIVHVVGARPNYMKIAPIIEALRPAAGLRQILV